MDNYLLISLILVPALAAIVVAFVPREKISEIRILSGIVAFALFVMSVYAFINYDKDLGGYQFTRDFAWLDGLGIQLSMGIDGISTTMVLLTGIVSFTAVLISWNIEHRAKDFFVLFLLLVSGVYGVFVSLDLFFFFFFYELAVLPMYLLIGVWGSSSDFVTFIRNKEYGALKLMLYLVDGSILVWVELL